MNDICEICFEWDSCDSGCGINYYYGPDTNTAIHKGITDLKMACAMGDTIEATATNEDTGEEWTFHLTPFDSVVLDYMVCDC